MRDPIASASFGQVRVCRWRLHPLFKLALKKSDRRLLQFRVKGLRIEGEVDGNSHRRLAFDHFDTLHVLDQMQWNDGATDSQSDAIYDRINLAKEVALQRWDFSAL